MFMLYIILLYYYFFIIILFKLYFYITILFYIIQIYIIYIYIYYLYLKLLNLYIIYVYIIFKCIYSFICQGGGFLRGVAFWSIKSSGLLRFILHDPGVTFLWQAEYFRQMAWKNRIYGQTRGKKMEWKNCKATKRIGTRSSAFVSTFHF